MTNLKPVLTWVNQEREKRGMEPLERLPKGQQLSAKRCPVAVAVEGWVSEEYWYPMPKPPWEPNEMPSLIAQFIRDFDNGKYPELMA